MSKQFYADIKSKAVKHGRSPDEVFILPGLVPLVGRTKEEAQAKYRELNSLLVTDYDLAPLSARIGINLSAYPLDGPLPDLSLSTLPGDEAKWLVGLAQRAEGRKDITVRELFHYFAATSRGHLLIVGDPEEIADQMEEWFVQRAADGFNICPPYMTGGIDLFIDSLCRFFSVVGYSVRNMKRTRSGGTSACPAPGTASPGRRHCKVRASSGRSLCKPAVWKERTV